MGLEIFQIVHFGLGKSASGCQEAQHGRIWYKMKWSAKTGQLLLKVAFYIMLENLSFRPTKVPEYLNACKRKFLF